MTSHLIDTYCRYKLSDPCASIAILSYPLSSHFTTQCIRFFQQSGLPICDVIDVPTDRKTVAKAQLNQHFYIQYLEAVNGSRLPAVQAFQDQNISIIIETQKLKLVISDMSRTKIKNTESRIVHILGRIAQLMEETSLISQVENRLSPLKNIVTNKLKFTMPKALLRTDLDHIQMQDFLFSPKLNGTRQWIYINDHGHLFKIDRNHHIEPIKHTNALYFKDTLYDAEEFEGVFYLFDTLMTSTLEDPYVYTLEERIELINKVCETERCEILQPKRYYKDFKSVVTLLQQDTANNKFDGVILTPKNIRKPEQILQYPIFKWKNIPTIDLKYIHNKHDHTGDLYMNDGQTLISFTRYFRVSPIFLHAEIDNRIVECFWNYQLQSLQLKQIREDKIHPNYIKTCEDVWQQIMYPVTLEDLNNKEYQEILTLLKNNPFLSMSNLVRK